MKVRMICFSQTGNTRKIADHIQSGVFSSGHACDIVSMKQCRAEDLRAVDLVGFGTPTFFYREPLNVTQFIAGLEETHGAHCFLFCTHGSIIGNTFHFMQKALKKKGYIVVDVFDAYADSSLQFYPEVMHTAGHPDAVALSEAEAFGVGIVEKSLAVRNSAARPMPEIQGIFDTWWARDSQMLTPDQLRQIFPKFEIDVKTCTQCMQCRDNCPVDAIDMDVHPPQIQKEGCIYCLYCEKQCPEDAIIADWTHTARMIRPNLKKYVEVLKDAERRGVFRPYVDYEKII